jgi:hypothetical protein
MAAGSLVSVLLPIKALLAAEDAADEVLLDIVGVIKGLKNWVNCPFAMF